ncbi:hypothetical protein [Morganella morganii]|uniref:hypothetical protein n=1 Tax=Morganella morganii TaxID=582 RepID=UPI0038901634
MGSAEQRDHAAGMPVRVVNRHDRNRKLIQLSQVLFSQQCGCLTKLRPDESPNDFGKNH